MIRKTQDSIKRRASLGYWRKSHAAYLIFSTCLPSLSCNASEDDLGMTHNYQVYFSILLVRSSIITLSEPNNQIRLDSTYATFRVQSHENCIPAIPAICVTYGWPHARLAQRGDFQIEEISGPSGKPIPIRITLPTDIQLSDSGDRGPVFLMFGGLPPEITLSAGFRIRDRWAVSLRDAATLSMMAPESFRGSYTLTVTLHKGTNNKVETRLFTVHLGAAEEAAKNSHHEPVAQPQPVTLPPPAITSSISSPSKRLSEGEEVTLLANAEEMLKSGDIAAARLVYRELATHGSGKAAFLMAQTYDPQVLGGRFVVGLEPNPEQAKQWYTRAAELGDASTQEHLKKPNASE